MWVFLLLTVSVVRGFLLDTQKPGVGQTGTADQYLTVSEFYDEKKLLQQETERNHQNSAQLRHDMDKNLAVLTSQLQLRFEVLERSLREDGKLNETKQDLILLEQKYTALEQNKNALQTSFEQLKRENSLLQDKYNSVDRELIVLKNKTSEYEELAKNIDSHYHVNTVELEMLKNTTTQLSKNMTDLRNLQNIKPLLDISSLQNSVQSLTTTTHSLSMKEQARSQDFLALYNMTIDSRKTSIDLETNINRRFVQLMNNQSDILSSFESNILAQLKTIQTTDNMKFSSIGIMVDDIKRQGNETFHLLQQHEQQINDNAEQVALLALNQQSSVTGIIKFNDVKFSIGFNNLATFTNTGKIVCEKNGLYMITVSIVSSTTATVFKIMLNSNLITNNQFVDGGHWHTGTSAIVLQLHTGDNVWVQTDKALSVSGGSYSSFSFIKVK